MDFTSITVMCVSVLNSLVSRFHVVFSCEDVKHTIHCRFGFELVAQPTRSGYEEQKTKYNVIVHVYKNFLRMLVSLFFVFVFACNSLFLLFTQPYCLRKGEIMQCSDERNLSYEQGCQIHREAYYI